LTQPTRANFERELAQVCLRYGLGVIPYSPLAAGFLTGKYQRNKKLPQSARAKGIASSRFTEQNWDIIERLQELAHKYQANVAQLALAWLLSKPYMTAPIVGANSVKQLKELMPAASLELSPEDVQKLDEVSSWDRTRTERED
jgi:aryl-alcohol dehydrogenase-like predicted oxidoreductase